MQFESGSTVDREPGSTNRLQQTQHRLLKACFTTDSVLLIKEPIQKRGTQGKKSYTTSSESRGGVPDVDSARCSF